MQLSSAVRSVSIGKAFSARPGRTVPGARCEMRLMPCDAWLILTPRLSIGLTRFIQSRQGGIYANHLLDLRTNLSAALGALNLPAINYQYPMVTAQASLIHKADIQELRNAVK